MTLCKIEYIIGKVPLYQEWKEYFIQKFKEEDLYETAEKEKGWYFITRDVYTYRSYMVFHNKI